MFWLLLLLCTLAPKPTLAVHDRMPLSMAANGIDGELQLMQDVRITPDMQKALWGTGHPDEKVAHAALRVVAADGKTTDYAELERPLARLEGARLYGNDAQTYLVTVDYSAGMGSYNGPITFFVEVKNGRLTWLTATERTTGKSGRITVMSSLKTVWQIVPARKGAGKDILEARCRPAFKESASGDMEFTLSYFRYSFDGKRWIRRVREEKGYSDFEDGFPHRRLFP
jgi:hypothetical protein